MLKLPSILPVTIAPTSATGVTHLVKIINIMGNAAYSIRMRIIKIHWYTIHSSKSTRILSYTCALFSKYSTWCKSHFPSASYMIGHALIIPTSISIDVLNMQTSE
uniref:Uncharacterized protein n=1 Tax=Opuntia streptacantha TaxID=393608 RepID=A0A7C8ZVB0_OPUST